VRRQEARPVLASTRAPQPALAKALGKPVVVENQPVRSIVGIQTLTRAAPGRVTLGIVSNNAFIFPQC
jgi:hypothetical protein